MAKWSPASSTICRSSARPGGSTGRLLQPRAAPATCQRIDPQASDRTAWIPRRVAGGAAEIPLFVRVERQTLRRLPESGDILFTIKVHHDLVTAFARHPEGAELAEGLRTQLEALMPTSLPTKGADRRARGHRRPAPRACEIAARG
ncbi:MAG: DUF3445 domain-containing protein [Alphaproteobacteria bacterium]|nr:DUF3445 domain-containing protein [Alphaproteobacteria bacterium]